MKLKDYRECKWFESSPFDSEGGYCLKEDAEISDPKENYCND